MKKIKLCLLIAALTASFNGFSQVGACCKVVDNGVNATCSQRTQADCLNDGGVFLGANVPCNSDGIYNCRTHICCQGSKCHPFLTKAGCDDITGAVFHPSATCRVCGGSGITVNLTSLKGAYSENTKSVQFAWQTEGVIDNGNFYIERGRNPNEFKTIGFVDPSAIANGSYTFADINPYQVGYYRLTFMSSGVLTNSQVLTVVAIDHQQLVVLPNPATATVRVLLSNMQLHETQVSFFDVSGRAALSRNLSKGQHEINVSTLAPGTYIVRAWQNGQVYTTRLIKK